MNYELCKELKEAGFPQKYPTGGHNAKGQRYWMHDQSDNDYTEILHDGYLSNALDNSQLTLIPLLSELIEACGEQFSSLGSPKYMDTDVWVAGYIPRDGVLIRGTGHTPKEAVARLWLALNKKG